MTEINPDAWAAAGPVIEAGDVGGDYQHGEAWSVQFQNETTPHAIIEVEIFAEQAHDAEGLGTGEYYFTSLTHYIIGSDPEDPRETETWSDMEYNSENALYGIDFTDPVAVSQMTKVIAEDYARKNISIFTWDGKPK